MAESLPGPSVKRKTSCGTIFKFSWTPSSAKNNKFVASSALAI